MVAVVFAELVGFAAQAEQLDPELERFGGAVEKSIGDAESYPGAGGVAIAAPPGVTSPVS